MPTPEQTQKTIRKINLTYLKGFLGAVILVFCAYFSAHWINHLNLLSTTTIEIIQLSSIVLAAAAIYGKKALSEIFTPGAETKEEKHNDLLFNILASLGFFLTVLAFHLKAQ